MYPYLKRILCVLLVIAGVPSIAQTTNSLLTNFRSTNNTTITIKTAPNSVTPVNVGGNIDSVCKYLTLWDLQAVCAAGARTTYQTAFGRSGSGRQVAIDSTGITGTWSSEAIWQFTNTSGVGLWLMKSRSNSNLIAILPSAISSNESIYLPNKPGLTDTFATLGDITAASNSAQVTTSVSVASTYTITSTSADINKPVYVFITAQSGNVTFAAPSGSWANGQLLVITYEDNGTSRVIAHNSIFKQGAVSYFIGTVPGQVQSEEYMYNSTSSGGPFFDLKGATYTQH